VSPDQAATLKKAFTELKESGITDPNQVLATSSKSGKISAVFINNLKQFNTTTHEYFSQVQESDFNAIDKWFKDQIEATKSRTDINDQDKNSLLVVQSVMRYGVKARLEAIPMPQSSKNGRAMAPDPGCISQVTQCVVNTLATYSGFGATVGGGAPGAAVGLIIGSAVSLATCQCANPQPCQYPTSVIIPAQCLASGSNLQVRVAGYGENPSGFELEVWDTPDRQNRLTAPLQDASQGNVFYVNSSTLQGRNKVYILPVTNCGGDRKYSPAIYEINLVELAQPQATLYGQSNVSVGSEITYGLSSGSNYTSIRWEIFSTNVGTIISQDQYSVRVRWTRPIGSPNAVYAKLRNACTNDDVTFSFPVTVNQ
jgi:hypothetical protein